LLNRLEHVLLLAPLLLLLLTWLLAVKAQWPWHVLRLPGLRCGCKCDSMRLSMANH
jgi:hypothetical protein